MFLSVFFFKMSHVAENQHVVEIFFRFLIFILQDQIYLEMKYQNLKVFRAKIGLVFNAPSKLSSAFELTCADTFSILEFFELFCVSNSTFLT